MSVRSSIEDTAVGVAKGHDHGEVTDLHILRALLTKFGTDGAGVTNKDVDDKLAQFKSAPSSVIAMSEDAVAVLSRVGNEEPSQIIGDLVSKHFGIVATASVASTAAPSETTAESTASGEVKQSQMPSQAIIKKEASSIFSLRTSGMAVII